jgi:hypothetical protein
MRDMSDERTSAPVDPIERERWLDGIVRLQEGAQLRGVSVDTIKREAARGRIQLLHVSQRGRGIRRRDALMIEEAS